MFASAIFVASVLASAAGFSEEAQALFDKYVDPLIHRSAPHTEVHVTDPAGSTWQRSYRVWFTRSHGDDHVCLTEIVLVDAGGANMKATFKTQSSCYGCAACDGCRHRYGDPLKQFDGIENADDESAWTCTAPGTFVNDLGSQNVVFTLPQRPVKLILVRPSMDGDWIPADWSIEEQQDDGTWWIIASVTDGAKGLNQSMDIGPGGQPLYEMMNLGPGWTYEQESQWAKNYPDCAGREQSPIVLPTHVSAGNALNLTYMYEPLTMRAIYNTGLGVQVSGKFGNLTLPGGVYDAIQFHLHFPSEHKFEKEGDITMGELHIVHRKQGSRGTDDLAMVSIMLRLPREHDMLVESEPFFMNLGLDNIPAEGTHGAPYDHPIDLNVFAPQLSGNFFAYRGSIATPPCTENVLWYVMATPAVISGVNILGFKERFPNPMNARPTKPIGDRQVLFDELLP